MEIVRTFNTAGPVRAHRDYQIAPLSRIDLEEVLGLIRDEKYFVLHAPRQTGKTSALLALRDLLNDGQTGDFRCLYANVENGQAMRENVAEAMRTVLAELAYQASVTLGDETLDELWPALLERVGPAQALRQALARWCMADPRPLVLLIDEIDALVGDTLLSVLRQLRTGYVDRPRRFPHSIVPVRAARRARLSHPLVSGESPGARRQRVQHQVGVVAARRLQRAGDARLTAQHTAADRAGVYRRCAAVDLGAHRRPAVAGERAMLRRLLPP